MTRRRRAPLVLRVCIGVFLLLFSAVTADTTKDPPTSTEKAIITDTPEIIISQSDRTIINKVPSNGDTELVSTQKANETTESTSKQITETSRDELSKVAETEDEEKVPIPIDENFNLPGIRSREQVDKLSTADSTNGGSKLEDILYGTSGKSSSTKTLSEDSYRLSGTNGLTTATARPFSEESKHEGKKAETARVQSSKDTAKLPSNKGVKPLADGLELKEEIGDAAKAESVASHGEINRGSSLKLGMINAESDSSEQKVRFLGGFQERRKKSESPGKNSEVPDLKEADENERNDGVISLINDTNVNYIHQYKTSTERDIETPLGDQSKPFEDVPGLVTHVSPSVAPKEEVEVVANVTHPAIQRFVEPESQNVGPKDVSRLNEVSEKSSTGKNQDPTRNSTETIEVSSNDQQKLEQMPSNTSTTSQGPSSPVPRGRTIAFSGINEFPGLDIKPTIASKLNISFAKKNTTDKPYPYVKSSTKDQLPNASNEVDHATEEPSTLENTIGKGQTEEKFIVTEASDVLENSIQQFKPSYFEEVSNESTVSSTEVRPSVPMTTASLVRLEEASPTNQSSVDKSGESNGIVRPEEKSSNEGNDVPRWSEGHEAITGKGSFDVTGNGITEVSLKPESDKLLQEIASRTTPASLTTESFVPRTDVQTNAEGSLLIRSTLNVSEASTEYPLINGNSSDKDKISPQISTADATTAKATESATVLPTSIEETSIGNVTEVPQVADINGNNEIPSGGSGTSSPDESLLATTTSIDYEFVGLTESTISIGRNSTEANDSREVQNGGFTVLPTVHDLQPKNGSSEVTTPSNELTTENSSTVSAMEAAEVTNIEDKVSSVPATDPTIVPTMQSKDDTTQSSVIDGQIDRNTTKEDDGLNTSSVAMDSSTTTTDGDTVTTTDRIEQTVSSDSKDSYSTMNVTGPPVEFTSTSNVSATTDANRVAPSDPFATSSLRPRIAVSSSTNSPTASDVTTVKTDDAKMMTPEQEEITSLVRIDMEGNRHDVCRNVGKLKLSLVEIFRSGMNKSVSDKQIKFHQNPCQESPSSTPTPSDIPLMSMLVYVVDENGKFDAAMTKILPRLYEDFRERVTFPVTIHRFLLVQETIPDSGNAIAVVVVSSVAFICLILLAGLLFIMRKRQTRFNYGERCRPVSLDAYSLDSVSAYNSVRRKGVARSSKRSYGNPTFEDSSAIPSHPLNFGGLSTFCNDVNAINDEFSGIPQVSAKIDELPTGAEVKNRYANVIPLPETRVPLQKINNDALTEYINASYVRGPKNATRYYIACQAPMESTVTDFWRMLWEQQCKVIIMLTDLVENGVEKCTEYIPPSEVTDCHRLYGDYQVTLKKRETKEKYAISTLHLKNLENNTFREVYHIWYLWPVNGAQSDGVGLIAVLLEARALQRGGPGPIVVHCSPGTGRSGTLIALDLGIRQYEITRTVDVPRVVYTIRRDRAGAVQTKEQYAFIYKALNLYATKLAGGVLEST